MIPNIPSTQTPSAYEDKQGRRLEPLIAYCVGGPAIRADNLEGTDWVAQYIAPNVVLYRADQPTDQTVLFTADDVTEVSLAFDQSMNPVIAYVQAGVAKFWWFDQLINAYTVIDVGTGAISPRVCLDIREQILLASSDLVLSYLRGRDLYAKVQRERFVTERLLVSDIGSYLINFGRSVVNRLQWRLRP